MDPILQDQWSGSQRSEPVLTAFKDVLHDGRSNVDRKFLTTYNVKERIKRVNRRVCDPEWIQTLLHQVKQKTLCDTH